MAGARAGVIVVGSFNVDHVWRATRLPRPGETLAGAYTTGPGGKGFNQAVAARRAGADVRFVCALGDDAGGALARDLAAADGIDLQARASDAPTGTAGIYTDDAGRNSIVIGPGANATLDAAFVEGHAGALAAAAVVLAQLESPRDAIAAALAQARRGGALAMLNPAPADAVVDAELLACCDLLTPNESEFAALLAAHGHGRIDDDAVAALDDGALHALCRALLPQGTVVVTLGGAGCFVSHADPARFGDIAPHARLPAHPARVVDTTGAGDAFNGALAAAIALQPQRAFSAQLRFASRYAAASTEHPGAASAMPLLRADG
ncbi:ribokinase [Luteimonas sp. MHLX1A]|uniref:ribokinase n=1 Tax=Alterluteimonas muca TaxID=2878684 RepID=UPI001E2B221C|nr:ribokinase [Luteimonas sp. MHLX1A]MCD9048004.1 ribokinase [Luteimonas sp. MHLX1A]